MDIISKIIVLNTLIIAKLMPFTAFSIGLALIILGIRLITKDKL